MDKDLIVDEDEMNKMWQLTYADAHDVQVDDPSSSPNPTHDHDHYDEIEALDGTLDDPEVMEKKVKEMRKLRSKLLKYANQLNHIRSTSKKREICLKNMTQRVIVEQDKMNTSLITLDRLSKKVSEAKLKVSQEQALLEQLDLDTKDKIQKLAQKEREYLVESEKLDSLEKLMKNRRGDLDKEIKELERVSGLIFKIDLESFSLLDFRDKLSKFQKEVEQKFIFLKEIGGHIDSEIEAKLKENLSKNEARCENTVDQNINQCVTIESRPGTSTSTRDKTSFIEDLNQIISKFSEIEEHDPIQVNLLENFTLEIPQESYSMPDEIYTEDQNQDIQKVLDPYDEKSIDELMSNLLKFVEETPSEHSVTLDEVCEEPCEVIFSENYSDEENESLKLEISSGSSEESSAEESEVDGEEKVGNKPSIRVLEILKGPLDGCESSECLETWDKIMSREEGRVKIIPELGTTVDDGEQNEIEETQNIVKIFESNVNQKVSKDDIMTKCNSEDMVDLSKDLGNIFNPFLLKLVNFDPSGSEDSSSKTPAKYSRKTPPKTPPNDHQKINVMEQKESSFQFRESEIQLIEDQNDMKMIDFNQTLAEPLVLQNQIKIKWSNPNCDAKDDTDAIETKIELEEISKPSVSVPPRPRQVVFDLEPILANSNSTSGLFNASILNIPSDFQDDGSSTSHSKGPRILKTRPPIPKVVKPISKMLQNQLKYEKKSSRAAHNKSTKSNTSTHTQLKKSIFSTGFHSTGSLPTASKVSNKKPVPITSSNIPKYTASSKLFTSTSASVRSSMIHPSNSYKAISKDRINRSHIPDHLKFGIFQNPSASSTSNSKNDLKKREK